MKQVISRFMGERLSRIPAAESIASVNHAGRGPYEPGYNRALTIIASRVHFYGSHCSLVPSAL
jgi:hypothetical protein